MPSGRRGEYERLTQDLAATSDCEDLPSTLVHSDCHLGNVVQAGRGPVLIDWQGAGRGPAVAALEWLLYSAAIQPPGPFDPLKVDAVLQGYGRHRTLNADELGLLADAVRFRPLVIAIRAFRESVRTAAPAIGWWSRYTEAEAVAQRAREYYAEVDRLNTIH